MNFFDKPIEKTLDKSKQDSLRLVIVRPGATDWDEQGRLLGNVDIPLSALGQRQAQDAFDEVSEMGIDAIYSAPDIASQQTAQQFSPDGRIRIRVEENLANVDLGLWHGKRVDELQQTQPKFFRQWQENPVQCCPPSGEPEKQIRSRIKKTLRKLKRKHRSGNVVVVVPEPLAGLFAAEVRSQQATPDDEAKLEPRDCGCWETVEIRDAKSVA